MLQEAEDNYITAKYLLGLAKRAYDLLKLVLQNLRLEGETVRYEAIKPFVHRSSSLAPRALD